MKKLLSIVNKIKQKFKYKKIQKQFKSIDSKVTVDIGASSLKFSDGKNFKSIRASVRPAEETEISIQNNKILVNNQWYIVGEPTTPTGNYTYKYEKPMLDILVLYAINELRKLNKNIGTNVKVNLLLPYSQLSTIPILKSKVSGTYNVNGEEITVLADRVITEGEASKFLIDKLYGTNKSSVCINMGYSTIDNVAFDENNNRIAISTINVGSNMLLSSYLKHFPECPSSSVLCNWFDSNMKLNKTEKLNVEAENEKFINVVWNDLYNSILRLCNKQLTTVYIMGGTANLLGDTIEKVLVPKGYKVVVLKGDLAKYTDLIGAMLLSNIDVEVPTLPKDKVPKEVPEVIEIPRVRKKNNYSLVVQHIQNGLSNDEIVNITSLKIQTVKNYRSKYNREILENNQLELAI